MREEVPRGSLALCGLAGQFRGDRRAGEGRFIVVASRGDGVVEHAVGIAGREIRGGGRGGFPRGQFVVGHSGHCRVGGGHCRVGGGHC